MRIQYGTEPAPRAGFVPKAVPGLCCGNSVSYTTQCFLHDAFKAIVAFSRTLLATNSEFSNITTTNRYSTLPYQPYPVHILTLMPFYMMHFNIIPVNFFAFHNKVLGPG